MEIAEFGRTKEEWLTQCLNLPNRIPSHDTFGRVLSLLDTDAFERCFFAWMKIVQRRRKGNIVALDGKSARRFHGNGQKPLHLVNAFTVANGIALGQRKVDGSSNEGTAIPQLLDLLMLNGYIVTTDAMGCRGWIVKKIRRNDIRGNTVLHSRCPVQAKQIRAAVRIHWSSENSLHWVLDVSFREDDSRTRIGMPRNIWRCCRGVWLA